MVEENIIYVSEGYEGGFRQFQKIKGHWQIRQLDSFWPSAKEWHYVEGTDLIELLDQGKDYFGNLVVLYMEGLDSNPPVWYTDEGRLA